MSEEPQAEASTESRTETQTQKTSTEPISVTIPERRLVLVEYSESVLQTLKEFADTPEEGRREIEALNAVIENISYTGQITYPWALLKKYIAFKIGKILDDFSEKKGFTPYNEDDSYDARRKNLFEQLDDFPEAPFTIQRICEVIVKPNHYTQTNSLLFGLEKLMCVCIVQKPVKPEDIGRINEICKANFETMKQRDEEERKRLEEEAEKKRKQEEEEAEKKRALKAQEDSDSDSSQDSDGNEDDDNAGDGETKEKKEEKPMED